jgi:sirohydrochlorin cobaltochelatase
MNPAAPTKSAIILFAHGARDPDWARPMQRIQTLLAARAPRVPVELAFLELMRPNLAEALRKVAALGAEKITLVPLFMAQGNHLRRDLPEEIDRACAENPGLIVRTTPAIGDVETLLSAIADWVLREEANTRDADLGHPIA